jgi:hypothetical protein
MNGILLRIQSRGSVSCCLQAVATARQGKIETRVRGMSKLTEKVTALFRRRRPVTREEAAEIADWVNEGGTFDPNGPPPVIDDEREAK